MILWKVIQFYDLLIVLAFVWSRRSGFTSWLQINLKTDGKSTDYCRGFQFSGQGEYFAGWGDLQECPIAVGAHVAVIWFVKCVGVYAVVPQARWLLQVRLGESLCNFSWLSIGHNCESLILFMLSLVILSTSEYEFGVFSSSLYHKDISLLTFPFLFFAFCNFQYLIYL